MIAVAQAPRAELPIAIRPMRPSEIRLVQSNWTRTFCELPVDDSGRTEVGGDLKVGRSREHRSRIGGMLIDRHELIAMHVARVDTILADPETQVAVAHDPDVDEMTAWACWRGPLLHWVFVQRVARRMRVASRLIAHTGCSAASHVTPEGRGLLRLLGVRR